MDETRNDPPIAASPEAVEEALRSFWRGDYSAIDQIIEEEQTAGDRSVCRLFGTLIEGQVRASTAGLEIDGYTIMRRIGDGAMGVVIRPVATRVPLTWHKTLIAFSGGCRCWRGRRWHAWLEFAHSAIRRENLAARVFSSQLSVPRLRC